ncbi:GNAT family acetyltransferase (macronuclear) [Tetrahymena thermophila SB210]|uniref:GNAT family acetyltransferase n=1 Tax=Tetrahymena thermophila (strain SB210) TaxID=312017 RepID=I7MGR9_TETTS|nr:GNAT family acetyltransferase [Tetrahymena thermophila SB210]EAS01956.1 GNAT family acetyltransferase [Tetrahymena thermophila SB210]|eukprot:XP_001022201.1 GNAT family acetyltransferase [Tetrahymena thermophila SB210]
MAESVKQKPFYYLRTEKLGLFPYLQEFIPIYHNWMQDEEILFLTGSEPLTLEEEKENQLSWLKDNEKYTFIIFEKDATIDLQQPNFPEYTKNYKMAGDINLFFHPYIEENEAEIDVMIGEKSARKKGLAQTAVQIMMDFGNAFFKKNRFIAKIKKENQKSISLFEKLGFKMFIEIESFQEVHYEFVYTQDLSEQQFRQKYLDFHQLQLQL